MEGTKPYCECFVTFVLFVAKHFAFFVAFLPGPRS
jgi:hypothetical protein